MTNDIEKNIIISKFDELMLEISNYKESLNDQTDDNIVVTEKVDVEKAIGITSIVSVIAALIALIMKIIKDISTITISLLRCNRYYRPYKT